MQKDICRWGGKLWESSREDKGKKWIKQEKGLACTNNNKALWTKDEDKLPTVSKTIANNNKTTCFPDKYDSIHFCNSIHIS